MKKILGLDLGTTSIGWALVNEAENAEEKSSIIRLGVRVNPLTTDEQTNFEKGKPITTNADRTLKRSMRRNLQRYKLRRETLIQILKAQGWINDETILSEQGNFSTFQTYRLRAKAATEEVSLEEFARVLLMINKKRGYKSSRKAKSDDEGKLIDGMDVARQMYDQDLTPGQYGYHLLTTGRNYVPEFYNSDLAAELDKIWNYQSTFYPEILTPDFRVQISRQGEKNTARIFRDKYNIYTADIKGSHVEKLTLIYKLRHEALQKQLSKEELALVISKVNGQANGSSGYLGAISDRSKELYFKHQTIGQNLIEKLDSNPHQSLKNKPYYRQDYLDEFERLWETQAQFHHELTPELKHEIRDIVIFYQRRLKSQKWLLSTCEFENRKVCPKSSPLFQEFKSLQIINNLEVSCPDEKRRLTEEERNALFFELTYKEKLTKAEVLKLLFAKPRELDLNFKEVAGNRTMAAILKACQDVISMSGHGEYDFSKGKAVDNVNTIKTIFKGLGFSTNWLEFNSDKTGADLDREPLYRLWHLLYSYEGDNSSTGIEHLVEHLMAMLNMPKEYAHVFASIAFEDDYGSLSAKALQKILPFMKEGHEYSEACSLAGYRHSKDSLTREELDIRVLKDHLDLLPRNSLRNPVVEKILNQMVNVVNGVIDEYGKPDEVRIELARELKKSAAEREELTKIISANTKEQEECTKILQQEFGLTHVSRNDIIRYRLYQELAKNGYKALYSNTYIPREKIFSKEIDIEHIIPQSRLFDDSFSNKTLEYRNINIEKGNATALDFVQTKYGDKYLTEYKARVEDLLKQGAISKAKAKKLLMSQTDIPDDFIERDLRNSQYISRKAQEMLREVARTVSATTGSITDRLREDWQIVNVMQELNWEKYDRQGLTEIIEGRDGQHIRRIKDWTKRNDHRHHAMDALTIAFTKPSYIQYLNNLNARDNKQGVIVNIEKKELYIDADHHRRFLPPILPIEDFRQEAKRHLEMILVSTKAKNKVVTKNINTTNARAGQHKKVQLTPRGQLHKESVCSMMKVSVIKEISVGAKMDFEMIAKVKNPVYRQALTTRLNAFRGDAKKAFTGKNSMAKNPIWLDDIHSRCVPEKVKVEEFDTQYVIRKPINKDINLDKVVDPKVKQILEERLNRFGGDKIKAFSNLDDNPIWLDQAHGICIKNVRCKLYDAATPLHDKRDKDGNPILDADGKPQPVDFVSTGNNHHVAIFLDKDGNLQEHIVSFFEATSRAIQGYPIIDKEYRKDAGWQFLFSMKQNEYFVFANPATGFDPNEIDLLDEKNYARISPNLYRVQKLSSKYYVFRHHLETNVDDIAKLRDITWKRIQNTNGLVGIVKVRINHLGKIVQVGEY